MPLYFETLNAWNKALAAAILRTYEGARRQPGAVASIMALVGVSASLLFYPPSDDSQSAVGRRALKVQGDPLGGRQPSSTSASVRAAPTSAFGGGQDCEDVIGRVTLLGPSDRRLGCPDAIAAS